MSEEIQGRLLDDRIRLGSEALPELYEQGYFGRPRGKGLELSLVEAAYLLDRSRISIHQGNEELDFRAFFQMASSLEKGFEFRYVVYKDLRGATMSSQAGRIFGSTPGEAIRARGQRSSMFWLYQSAILCL